MEIWRAVGATAAPARAPHCRSRSAPAGSLFRGVATGLQGSRQALAFNSVCRGNEEPADDRRQAARQRRGFTLQIDAAIALLQAPITVQPPQVAAAMSRL